MANFSYIINRQKGRNMRISIVNGNGCLCDICGQALYPQDILHIKVLRLSDNIKKAATGSMTSVCKIDICEKCFNELNLPWQRPRKNQ